MVLYGQSDASYLSESGSWSRSRGHFFITDKAENTPNNGAVMNISQIIKAVMSLAEEAELWALFVNFHEAIPERIVLEDMGHKQLPMPMHTNNTTALDMLNNNIVIKRLKSMDTIINCLQCRIAQEQFCHYWKPGPTNLGEYSTKHHAAIHHRTLRPTYLTHKKYLGLFRKRNQIFGAVAAYKYFFLSQVLDKYASWMCYKW